MQFTLPSITFDRSMILYRKSRTVEFLWLGNAHTNGDVWVYLPKEKILICGDALHGWTPFMGDSYPYDWIKTLDTAEKLDFDQALGGHGDVMHNKQTFELWKTYFHDSARRNRAGLQQRREPRRRTEASLKDIDREIFDEVPGNLPTGRNSQCNQGISSHRAGEMICFGNLRESIQ